MRFERITSEKHEMYIKALELYRICFPSHEQREVVSQGNILKDNEYHFSLIYDDDVFVGLVLYWETKTFIYIEHLCILPEMRNKKYGRKTLESLVKCGKTVILEIDPSVDSVSIRRKGFYERSGFVANPFSHIHPPYHRGNMGHKLVIMSFPNLISQDEYDLFKYHLDHHVMVNVFS